MYTYTIFNHTQCSHLHVARFFKISQVMNTQPERRWKKKLERWRRLSDSAFASSHGADMADTAQLHKDKTISYDIIVLVIVLSYYHNIII